MKYKLVCIHFTTYSQHSHFIKQIHHQKHEEKSLINDDLKANHKCNVIKQHG